MKPLTEEERKKIEEIYSESGLRAIPDRKVLKKRRKKEVE